MEQNEIKEKVLPDAQNNYSPWGVKMTMQTTNATRSTSVNTSSRSNNTYGNSYGDAYQYNGVKSKTEETCIPQGGYDRYNPSYIQETQCNQSTCGYNPCSQNGSCCCDNTNACKTTHTIQLQLEDPNLIQIEAGKPIIFDKLITQTSGSIQYDQGTGEIYILKSGTYYLNWWVGVDSIMYGDDIFVAFEVVTSQGQKINSSSANTFGQVVGNAILPINVCNYVPMKIKLINSTDGTIGFGQSPIKASLVIMKLIES